MLKQRLGKHLPVKREHLLRPIACRNPLTAWQNEDAVFHIEQPDADAGQLRAGLRVETDPLARQRLIRRSLGPLALDEQHIGCVGIVRAQLR